MLTMLRPQWGILARPAPDTAGRPRTFGVLQAFRGCAALAVVAFHLNVSVFGNPVYWPGQPFGSALSFGHAGVEFFFILSGFIILTAHWRDLGRPDLAGRYLWKRFRRIYPIYWVALALITAIFFANPSWGGSNRTSIATLVDSALLVHVVPGGDIVLDVSWTLFHEILFYGMFTLMIVRRRAGAVLVAAWLAGSLAVLAAGPELAPVLATYLFSPLHLLFALGMGAAVVVRRWTIPRPALVFATGLSAFAAVAVADVRLGIPHTDAISLSYGVASAVILVAAIELERSGRLRPARLLTLLGDASYSIYLFHFAALTAMAKILTRAESLGVELPHRLVFVLMFAVAVATGLVFYRLVERPLLAAMDLRPSRGRRVPRPAEGAPELSNRTGKA